MVKRMKRKNKAFTLVEILIVAAILSIISLALFSALSSGLSIWKRLNQGNALEDGVFLFERFGSDIRETFCHTLISFEGTEEEISFAGIVSSAPMNRTTVGKITYAYDAGERAMRRSALDYSDIFLNVEKEGRTVASAEECSFSYYWYDNQTRQYLWEEDWDRQGLPLAVRLTCAFGKARPQNLTRVFRIQSSPYPRNESDE